VDAGLAAATALVALVTLLPQGRGWTWASPSEELHWYVTGLGSETTMLQLTGNLALLGPLAVLAVLRWPALASPARLCAVAATVAVGIELLQWAMPLGRVVSPLDAALNTVGALLAGGTAAALTGVARRTASDAGPGMCHRLLPW
jgi:glycopeptide antibiotics resistance protein